jgi:PAS domain S-box-containing protein
MGKVDRDSEGRPLRLHGVNFDIIKRKQAEDDLSESFVQFRALAESIPQLAWMAEPDGHIFWYNRRWYEYTGTTLEEMAGWGWQSVHDPEVLPLVMQRWARSIESGEAFEMIFPLKGADGTYRAFLTRIEPVKDARGNVVRWFGTNTDIEVQKRSEDALKQANRHKDEFLAMLAHELRNPLSPIRNAVHLLKHLGPDNAMLVDARDMIDRQVTHLVRLVDDLLDISRITRGKIDLRKQPVDLRLVLDRAVESVKPLLDAKRHELTVTMPHQPVMVETDSTRLAQVVRNLHNNSAKYTEEGGRIWLTLDQSREDAAIRVRDNGMGIAPDLLPEIFDLYTQGERTLDRAQGGLGVGLALVRRLVEMQGGTVTAQSEGPGQGSEFIVYLPRMTHENTFEPSPASSEAPNHTSGSPRILVIDDNVDAARSLTLLLRHLGHEVQSAHDGVEALELARKFRPAIVFCDIGLPGIDGYEVARRLRVLPEARDAALIALTGYGQEQDRIDAATAGFHMHLLKPIGVDVLHDVLKKISDRDRPPPGSTGQ